MALSKIYDYFDKIYIKLTLIDHSLKLREINKKNLLDRLFDPKNTIYVITIIKSSPRLSGGISIVRNHRVKIFNKKER